MSSTYEPLLAFIAAQLPKPVRQVEEEDGTIVFTGGDPPEVVVRLTASSVVVSEYSVAQPIVIGSVKWPRVSEDGAMRVVRALMVAAREARRLKFSTCEMCARLLPPEWMHSADLCRGCADRQVPVVH